MSANTECNWDQRIWPSIRGVSGSQTAEYNHWLKNYGPKLVSSHIQSDFGDIYTSVKEGSYIEVEGYLRPLYISYKPTTKSTDGPQGIVLKEVHLDRLVSGKISFYFKNPPPDSEEVMLLQICKSFAHDLTVHALVIKCGEDGHYQRIGTAKLENYNLYGFVRPKSSGVCRFVAHSHPRERDGRIADMKNEEWQHARWEKRRIKIF